MNFIALNSAHNRGKEVSNQQLENGTVTSLDYVEGLNDLDTQHIMSNTIKYLIISAQKATIH